MSKHHHPLHIKLVIGEEAFERALRYDNQSVNLKYIILIKFRHDDEDSAQGADHLQEVQILHPADRLKDQRDQVADVRRREEHADGDRRGGRGGDRGQAPAPEEREGEGEEEDGGVHGGGDGGERREEGGRGEEEEGGGGEEEEGEGEGGGREEEEGVRREAQAVRRAAAVLQGVPALLRRRRRPPRLLLHHRLIEPHRSDAAYRLCHSSGLPGSADSCVNRVHRFQRFSLDV